MRYAARCCHPAAGRLNSGVRRQKSVWWLCFPMLLSPGFGWHCSSVRLWAVASSVKSVWRAHTSRTLRWPTSETVFGVGQFPVTDTVASVTSGEKFAGARPGLPASIFGNYAGVSVSPASFAPNNSFKPTPHRGVNSVLCATLARCRRPAVGRLNSGVRRQKSVWWFCCSAL